MDVSIRGNRLIISIEKNEISSYQDKIIKMNKFPELLNYEMTVTKEGYNFEYDLYGLISINDFRFKYDKINRVCLESELNILKLKIDDYLLFDSNILLEGNYIFIDLNEFEKKQKIKFKYIYLPLINKNNEHNQFENKKDILLKDKNIFTSSVELKTEGIDKDTLLDKLLTNEEEYINKKDNIKKIKVILIFVFVVGLYLARNNKIISIISVVLFLALYAITYLISKIDDEKEYNVEMDDSTFIIQNYPYLKRGLFDDKIFITLNEFKIGKAIDNNYRIENNNVSKYHAKIFKKDFGYYIEDQNSTNHTFVNDEMLEQDEQRLLINGDKIKFGNEQYQFFYENF